MNGYKKEEKWELRYEVPTAEGEEFADVPIDMTTWKRMLVQWGN